MRPLKFLVGLLLLPLCVSATLTLVAILKPLQAEVGAHAPAPFLGLVAGALLWVFLYFCLPRPTRTYVLGHELTHALWAWLMGGGVRRMRVSSKGGSVQVTKNNFLITLAPYFFPFYTVCVMLVYVLASLFFDQRVYEPFWLGCIGLTWAFHFTFTIDMLRQHQPDIHLHGRLFSYAVIYLLNVLGVALWAVMVTSPTLAGLARQLAADVGSTLAGCRDLSLALWALIMRHMRQRST